MSKTVQEQTGPKLEYLSPDVLDFDPENPRFGGLASGKSQGDIQAHLIGEPHYASELVDSLLENGFIDYEPLVAKRKDKRLVVIEGNRRLAAIREIRGNPDRHTGRKSDLGSIPVLVFPDKPDEQQQNEMRVYLGVRHLIGFREWPPISKAQFLERESKAEGGLDRVLREVRMTRQNARRLLVPFRLLNRASVLLPKGEDFWVLGEALQRTGIKKYLQLEVNPKTLDIVSYDKKNLSALLNDLYGPKRPGSPEREVSARVVYDTRDLSRLARVLGSDKATAELHAGKDLEEAQIYVDTREESLSRLSKVNKDLALLLKKVVSGNRDPEGTRLLQSYRAFDTAVKAFVNKNAKPSL
jgi:hypothetical protein